MALNTENDSLMCKCFPTSLAGLALNWFKNLPRGSVDSFRSLCDRFISQYYGNKHPAKDILSLFTMKQHDDERLQAFLTRFNLTKSMVIECHPSTAVQAFILAMTRGTPLRTSLIPHKDPLVISLTVAECLVSRVLIDPGSSVNVMPRDTFDGLEIKQD
ncbi:uncharacterized protein LOC132309656 [Cornus florida]|uniref:uncharacterized protein LOC132309656 n=1 Tax=Cornus florida TaxID=4283 RepID=UPI00289AD086|nr:uncharacterized protein LOC132309656 [Cornus florida]